jgi:hypothetical protein
MTRLTVVGSVATPATVNVFVRVANSLESAKNTVAPTVTYPSEIVGLELARLDTVAVGDAPPTVDVEALATTLDVVGDVDTVGTATGPVTVGCDAAFAVGGMVT